MGRRIGAFEGSHQLDRVIGVVKKLSERFCRPPREYYATLIADVASKSLHNTTEPKANVKGGWAVVADQVQLGRIMGRRKSRLGGLVGLREVGRAERRLKICLVSDLVRACPQKG